jgi:hypothetical protein
MMRIRNQYEFLTLLILLVAITALPATGQVTIEGGKGMLRIHDAEPVYPGLLYFNASYLGYVTSSEGNDAAEDHTLNLGLTLGLSRQFSLSAQLVPYQDDQQHLWGPPGDSRVSLKWHVPKHGGMMQFGVLAGVSIPTATNHNVQFERFTTDKPGWQIMALVNMDLKQSASRLPLKFSFNIGFRDHDWFDRFFMDDKDQLIGGLGFKFPVRSSLLYTELSGEVFINNTETVSFTENLLRVTQGLRFVGPWNLIVDVAGDYSLTSVPGEDRLAASPFLKDYADWKVIVGISTHTTLFTWLTPEERADRERKQEEMRKRHEIRRKREQVSEELEKMREKLEEEKKPKPE